MMIMPVTFYLLVFLFSLFLGSFYNVVALRTLSGESILGPKERSHCTSCDHELSFLDMVPVFSWLFLRGRCRYCGEKVSPLYPFGELLTGISYTLVVWQFGFTIETLIQLVLVTILVWATITDLKVKKVPNKFTIIGLVVVMILRIISGVDLLSFIIGGVGSFGVLLLFLVLSRGKMGGADVKLYALIGLALGFPNAMASLMYASFVGVIVNIPMLVGKKEPAQIPFVPFITAGVLLTYLIDIQVIIDFIYLTLYT